MPNRIIKESIKTSSEIDSLSWFEECVFYRLMVSVDDYGCFDGRVIVIKNELFPTKENITTKAVGDAIEKLERVKLLSRYDVDGKPYIHLTTWEEHQRVRNKHRKYPIPTLDSNLLTNDRQMSATCQLESESESEIESESISRENKSKSFTVPSVDEIKAYCTERNNNVDPQKFYDYYSSADWKDKNGNKVINWKQKMIANWENKTSKHDDALPIYDASTNKKLSDNELNELLALRRS